MVEELDGSLGEVLAAVVREGLAHKTLVVFASDNGPFLSYGDHAGSARPYREGKLTAYEGGVRVPCIVRWPVAGSGGKPANFGKMHPLSMGESGIRGVASRHGYEVARQSRALYHLGDDPGESQDVAAAHPDVVARLERLAETARADLGDALMGMKGPGIRPAGDVRILASGVSR